MLNKLKPSDVQSGSLRGQIEKMLGRQLTEDEQAEVDLTLEQDLKDSPSKVQKVFEGLPARIVEHAWELAAESYTDQVSLSIAQDECVVSLAVEARRKVFGCEDPPFPSLEDAHAWALEEQGDLRALAAQLAEGVEGKDLPLARDIVETALRSLIDCCPVLRWSVRLRIPLLWLPSLETGQDLDGETVWSYNSMQYEAGRPVSPSGLHRLGERDYFGATPAMRDLAFKAVHLANMTGVWTDGQAAAFIMTGIIPDVPRWRVWVRELPGGTQRQLLELYGPMNWHETQEFYRILRERSGMRHKKSFSMEDLQLVDFVDEQKRLRRKSQEILQEWNHTYPERAYGKYQSLWTASKRARARRNRP